MQAGLSSLPPYAAKAAPADDRFLLLIGRTATLTHGQSFNNPLLNERAPEQVLWIHPDRARPLGIGDGDTVEVRGGVGAGSPRPYVGRIKAHVTPWIHREAVFMLHGFGATVPLATRAGPRRGRPALQDGKLYDFDPAGGGCALTETVVQIQPAGRHQRRRRPRWRKEATCEHLHPASRRSELHFLPGLRSTLQEQQGPRPRPGPVARSSPWGRSTSVDSRTAHRLHALLPLRGSVVRQGLPHGRHAAA